MRSMTSGGERQEGLHARGHFLPDWARHHRAFLSCPRRMGIIEGKEHIQAQRFQNQIDNMTWSRRLTAGLALREQRQNPDLSPPHDPMVL